MLDKRALKSCLIQDEMDTENKQFWFDFKKKKFLHNIDTFYYSVKFKNDFTEDSKDSAVINFRKFLYAKQQQMLKAYGNSVTVNLTDLGNLNMLPLRFTAFYNVCLEKPEEFHLFIAPKVPKSQNGDSVTCEMIVQIRSYMLWLYGVHDAFEKTYMYVKRLADLFHLEVDFVQENRADYCWHSNYLSNPEKFFSIENFYKMRVDRFRGAHFNTEKVGSEDYLIDYIALGKRGQKCFVRIYLKSKEVVEMGYKPFFFKIWLFHGLINRYDLYCYEECFKRGNWSYLDIARLQYYSEYGQDAFYKKMCADIVAQNDIQVKITDKIRKLADELTPKINLVVNVEFQTMRKASKTYPLIPFKDNSDQAECKRIYDYLDNHYLIANYLTSRILRLVEPSGDSNKSRRDDCGFWKALRKTKMVDVLIPKTELSFIRQYNRRISVDVMKRQLINKAVMLSFYNKGINQDSPAQDVMDSIMILNDNDIKRATSYKAKKSRQLSANELSGLLKDFSSLNYTIVNNETGVIYNHDTIETFFLQDN